MVYSSIASQRYTHFPATTLDALVYNFYKIDIETTLDDDPPAATLHQDITLG